MRKLIIAALIAASLAGCSSIERQQMRNQSEYGYGVPRTVTAYSTTGEQVGQWNGNIDVAYVAEGGVPRVDLVIFDGEKAVDRVVISGAIVVVDNE